MAEPEVDTVVPLAFGKRWVFCFDQSSKQFGAWDLQDLAKAPSQLYESNEEAWVEFQKVEPSSREAAARCPTCRSRWATTIQKSDKFADWMLMGVFAIGKMAKTFRCGRCGYTW